MLFNDQFHSKSIHDAICLQSQHMKKTLDNSLMGKLIQLVGLVWIKENIMWIHRTLNLAQTARNFPSKETHSCPMKNEFPLTRIYNERMSNLRFMQIWWLATKAEDIQLLGIGRREWIGTKDKAREREKQRKFKILNMHWSSDYIIFSIIRKISSKQIQSYQEKLHFDVIISCMHRLKVTRNPSRSGLAWMARFCFSLFFFIFFFLTKPRYPYHTSSCIFISLGLHYHNVSTGII
jgi:hypothetical protein